MNINYREINEQHYASQIEALGDSPTTSVTAVRRIVHAGHLYEAGQSFQMRQAYVKNAVDAGNVTQP